MSASPLAVEKSVTVCGDPPLTGQAELRELPTAVPAGYQDGKQGKEDLMKTIEIRDIYRVRYQESERDRGTAVVAALNANDAAAHVEASRNATVLRVRKLSRGVEIA